MQWERRWPIFLGVASFVLFTYFGSAFFSAALSNNWKVEALYSSVFNVASAASAFLFAFYTYVRTAEGRILSEIRRTNLFKRATNFMLRAVVSSIFLALCTIPLLVVVPQPTERSIVYIAICMWAAFTVYVLAAVIRSVYHFISILEASFGERLES